MIELPKTPRQAARRLKATSLLPVYLYYLQESAKGLVNFVASLNLNVLSAPLQKINNFLNTNKYNITFDVFIYALGVGLLVNLFFRKGILGMLSLDNLKPKVIISNVLKSLTIDILLVIFFYFYFSDFYAYLGIYENLGVLIFIFLTTLLKLKNSIKYMIFI